MGNNKFYIITINGQIFAIHTDAKAALIAFDFICGVPERNVSNEYGNLEKMHAYCYSCRNNGKIFELKSWHGDVASNLKYIGKLCIFSNEEINEFDPREQIIGILENCIDDYSKMIYKPYQDDNSYDYFRPLTEVEVSNLLVKEN